MLFTAVFSGLFSAYSFTQSGFLLDTTFSDDGINVYDLDQGSFDQSMRALPLSGGKLLMVGTRDSDLAFVKHLPDGSLDATFGQGGMSFYTSPDNYFERPIANLDSDGNILVAGSFAISGNTHMRLYRFHPDGSLDTGFGNNGFVQPDLGASPFVKVIKFQDDGKIVVGGYVITGGFSTHQFFMVRYNSDGSPDNTFSSDGIVVKPYAGESRAFDIDLQQDNGIIIVGEISNSPGTDYIVYRYTSTGSLDNTFNNGQGSFSYPDGSATSVHVLADNKILLGGSSATIRLNASGTIDNSYGNQGYVLNSPSEDLVHVHNHSWLLKKTDNYSFKITLLDSLGTIFPLPGSSSDTINLPISTSDYSLSAQADGKIIVTGQATSAFDFIVIRLLNIYGVTSVEEHLFPQKDFLIYPNPFNQILHSRTELTGQFHIKLYDSAGKLVYEHQLSELMETTFFQRGTYFYEIFESSENPTPIRCGKLIKN